MSGATSDHLRRLLWVALTLPAYSGRHCIYRQQRPSITVRYENSSIFNLI